MAPELRLISCTSLIRSTRSFHYKVAALTPSSDNAIKANSCRVAVLRIEYKLTDDHTSDSFLWFKASSVSSRNAFLFPCMALDV